MQGEHVLAPRALVYDVRDSVGLHRVGSLWSGGTTSGSDEAAGHVSAETSARIRAAAHARLPSTAFHRQLMEDTGSTQEGASADWSSEAHSWGDFCKARMAPGSLMPLGGRDAAGEVIGRQDAATLSSESSFDAFTLGAGLVNEAVTDPFRALLEACDHAQAVQAIVDVDSGFGGFAADMLESIVDDVGRIPVVVFGCAAPEPVPSAPSAGGFMPYAQKDRAAVRSINLALAFSEWASGASSIVSAFIPLSLSGAARACHSQPYALPWALRPGALDGVYASSAVLASYMDSMLLSVRQNPDFGDGLLSCASMCEPTSIDTTLHSREQAARYDPSLELSAARPVVQLPPASTMTDVLQRLLPVPARRLLVGSMAMPAGHARSTATQLRAALHAERPVHTLGLPSMLPVSLLGGSAHNDAPWHHLPPSAHMLISRGVSTSVLAASARTYASSKAALGHALESCLERSECSTACHASVRTPLPVYMGFPPLLRDTKLDIVGDRRDEVQEDADMPYTLSTLVHMQSGPACMDTIQPVLDAFVSRDPSVVHRFAVRDTAIFSVDFADVTSKLHTLADEHESR